MFRALLVLVLLLTLAHTQSQEEILQNLQNQNSMKRTACLVLSRYHSNSLKEVIENIIMTLPPEEQQPSLNKMYAVAIEHCLPLITMDQTQKFFVEDPSFDPSEMFYIFEGFDYDAAASNPTELTKAQESLIKFTKKFDEEMQVKREEKEAEENQGGEQSFEMKFLGFAFHEIPSFLKMIYFVAFMGIFVVAILYGLKKIEDHDKPKVSKKRRPSPKKTQ